MRKKRQYFSIATAIIAASTMPCRGQPIFATPIFLLDYKTTAGQRPPSDYRPSPDASGTRIVFERSQYVGGAGNPNSTPGYGIPYLYVVDLRFHEMPRQIYRDGAARADWCWRTTATTDGKIAFSGLSGGIFTINPDVSNSLVSVKNSASMYYPAWYPACNNVAVKQIDPAIRGPSNYRVDVTNGHTSMPLSGSNVWAGFVDVNKVTPRLSVFAGQPIGASTSYDEDRNYIFVAEAPPSNPSQPIVSTLEPVPAGPFAAKFQGRAPTWSPEGVLVAFESNRNCYDKSLYAIFIKRYGSTVSARQVTACQLNAQHARWFSPTPGSPSRYLIVAAYQPRTNPSAFGIAALDVTEFIPD